MTAISAIPPMTVNAFIRIPSGVPSCRWTSVHCRLARALCQPAGRTLLVDYDPHQARLLDRVCSGPLLPIADLHEQNALATPPDRPRKHASGGHGELFGGE